MKFKMALATFFIFFVGFGLVAFKPTHTGPCINIYYDRSPDPSYWMGQTYAMMLQNLLGHFPEFQQMVSPIEFYQKGEIEQCAASFYIGSYFNNAIPKAFFEDFQKTKNQVAWLGYNLWNLPEDGLEKLTGYTYQGLTVLDQENRDPQNQPGFFKEILYKGEVFFKYGRFKKEEPHVFVSSFEMLRLEEKTAKGTQVLAEARHSGTGETLPYILRNQNHFFVADVPFSYIHEADRYMVFADLLFDILQAQPRHQVRPAFLRIEDIHPLVPLPYLYNALNTLKAEQVPMNISVIPIFFDPLHEYTRSESQEFITLTQVPEFMSFLREAQKNKAVMIWHGNTHQLGTSRNPHSGVSGDDFEFWDAVNNRALPQDSSDFVLDRMDSGFYDLAKAQIFPKIWLTPHYQASPLDYLIFARVFPWNVGRVIYFNNRIEKAPLITHDEDYWYSAANNNAAGFERRAKAMRELKIDVQNNQWTGQIYPFEVYGDVFGQRLLPENLGNSQPTENEHVVQPRSVQEMIADAKRNLVIRDAWASFFYHVQLFNIDENGGRGRYPGDTSELVYLIRELKKLGYQFIDLEDFVSRNTLPVRPEPIYRNQGAP